jgi:hypothetical protein
MRRLPQGVTDMAEETGSFDSSKQTAEQITKRIQEMMASYFGWLQKSRWGTADLNTRLLTCATEQISAASTFVNKLSQAADLQDVVKLQIEFVQMQMTMFTERTKEIGNAVAAATNLLDAFVSILHWRQVLEDLARNSPRYRQTGGNERTRTWSAVPTQR